MATTNVTGAPDVSEQIGLHTNQARQFRADRDRIITQVQEMVTAIQRLNKLVADHDRAAMHLIESCFD